MADTDTSASTTKVPPLNELVVKWRKRYPVAYDHIDDATLTRKILAKYPVYAPLTVNRPAPPDELKPSTGMERVGERIKQNVYFPVNALEGHTATYQSGLTTPKAKAEAAEEVKQSAAGYRHMAGLDAKPILGSDTLGKVAGVMTMGPRMIYEQGKQYYQDPSALAGDIITFFPELENIRLPKSRPTGAAVGANVTSARPTTGLDPVAQAKYTEELDAANQQYGAEAKKHYEAVDKSFDTAKREQLAMERTKTLMQGVKDTVKGIHDNLKKTFTNGRTALNQRWGEWNKGVEGITRDPKSVYDAIEAAKATKLRGSPGSLVEFNNLMGELGVQEFEDSPEGRKAIVGQTPVPIETLRTHYSAIVRRIMKGGLPGNIYHALEAVRDAVDKQIIEGAKTRSTPEQDLVGAYNKLKSDEYQFDTDWIDRKSPLANALKQLDANFLEPKILGRGNEYIAKQLGKYTQYGADPAPFSKVVKMAEDAKAAAKEAVKVGAFNIPEKTLPATQPELKPVEPPEAGAAKAGRISRAMARVVGKLAGAAAGTLVYHPMVGWAVGGEIAPEILDRIIANRAAKGAGATTAPVTAADMVQLEPVERTGIQNGITKRLIAAAEKGEPLPPLAKFKDVLTREQMQQVLQAAMKNKTKTIPQTPTATPVTPAAGGAPEQAPRGSLPRDKSASNTGEPGPISSIETHPIPGILNDLQNRLNA